MEPMDMDENLIPKEKKTRDYKWVYAVVGLLAGCLFTFGVSYLCFTLGKEKKIEIKKSNEQIFNSSVLQALQNRLDQQAPQTGRISDNVDEEHICDDASSKMTQSGVNGSLKNKMLLFQLLTVLLSAAICFLFIVLYMKIDKIGVNAIKDKQDEILILFKEMKNNNSRELDSIKQLVKTETVNSKNEVKRVVSDNTQRLMTKDDSNVLLKLLQKVQNDTQRENLKQIIINASKDSKDNITKLIEKMMKQLSVPSDFGSEMLQYISNMTQSQSKQMAGSMNGVIEALHSMMNISMGTKINVGLPTDIANMQKTVVETIKNATIQVIALIKDTREQLLTGKTRTSTILPDTSTTSTEITTVAKPKHDCLEWYRAGSTTSGIYSININQTSDIIDVYCDMSKEGGGWLVFQQRTDGSENFNRVWTEYEDGFGNKSNEFWLGNQYLNLLTKNTPTELRIDLEDWSGAKRYAKYSTFRIGDAASKYSLYVTGYSGNAGDGLNFHHELKFSTKDQDNEKGKGGCAASLKGGWWFDFCAHSSLNGEYIRGGSAGHNKGINWQKWKGDNYSLRKVSMMLRRKS